MKDDHDIVTEIIKKSGNSFHIKVLKYLERSGWSVLISPYYNDNVSNKPREIDLLAEKSFPTVKDHFGRAVNTINVRLYIECKYIDQPNVFWFHARDINSANNLVRSNYYLPDNNRYTLEHHYLKDNLKVAKLFACNKSVQSDNEPFYKALNQSINAMIYHRGKGTIINSPKNQSQYIRHTIDYPVIVCSSLSRLYSVDISTESAPALITDNFQLEVNYAYINASGRNIDEYFLIDITSIDKIDEFLKCIEHDAEIIGFLSGD